MSFGAPVPQSGWLSLEAVPREYSLLIPVVDVAAVQIEVISIVILEVIAHDDGGDYRYSR